MNPYEKAIHLLETQRYMTMATVDEDERPWISPVFYSFDQACSLYWVSSPQSEHSRNIAENDEVAISIWGPLPDGSPDGLYFRTEAEELVDDDKVEAGIAVMGLFEQHPKFTIDSPADVTGSSAWRLYRADPHEIYKRSDTGRFVDGRYITTRDTLDLGTLVARLSLRSFQRLANVS